MLKGYKVLPVKPTGSDSMFLATLSPRAITGKRNSVFLIAEPKWFKTAVQNPIIF